MALINTETQTILIPEDPTQIIAIPDIPLNLNMVLPGCLAGSVGEAHNSWSQGCEFNSHVGMEILKNKIFLKNNKHDTPYNLMRVTEHKRQDQHASPYHQKYCLA